MLKLTEINITTLPFVEVINLNKLPRISGIYFALDLTSTVIYIGKAFNIYSRWKNHEKGIDLILKGVTRIYYLAIPKESLTYSEKFFITKFDPPMNISGTIRESATGKRVKGQSVHWDELKKPRTLNLTDTT